MRRHVCFSLWIFMFLSLECGAAVPTTNFLPSQQFCSKTTKSWFKTPKEIQEEQHIHFLHHVIAAIKQPEIWNNPSNLLHILLQFEQFPQKESLCHYVLITIILNRVALLTMNTPFET